MPLAQLADPWQKMPMGGTPGEVRRCTNTPEPLPRSSPGANPTFCRVCLRFNARKIRYCLVNEHLKVTTGTHFVITLLLDVVTGVTSLRSFTFKELKDTRADLVFKGY